MTSIHRKDQHAVAGNARLGILFQLRADAAPWLAEQGMARGLLARIIDHRRTLTPEMRELAGAVRLEL